MEAAMSDVLLMLIVIGAIAAVVDMAALLTWLRRRWR
jgi:hypothetical protein